MFVSITKFSFNFFQKIICSVKPKGAFKYLSHYVIVPGTCSSGLHVEEYPGDFVLVDAKFWGSAIDV